MPVSNEKKILYCAMSLYNIAVDMKDVDLTVHQISLSLSKYLMVKIEETKGESVVPEAIVHSESAPHNTKIGDEIESIIKEIREAQV